MDSQLLIFDDGRGQFGPLMDLRAVFEFRSGAVTAMHRIESAVGRPLGGLHVRPLVAAAIAQRRKLPVNQPPAPGNWLLVNGRWLGLIAADQVRSLPLGQVLLDHAGSLVAAHLPHDKAQQVIDARFDAPPGIPAIRLPAPRVDPFAVSRDGAGSELMLIDRPWHLLDQLEATLLADLNAFDLPLFAPPSLSQIAITGLHPCKVAADAKVMPMVVLNAEKGPIVIDAGAQVHSFAILNGPCYIGPRSTINAHADIRPNTVIGPACKIGGEVSFSIIHGYTNKAHLGYMGHSLVGAWVNFGAATSVSNLKNTYGSIRVQLEKDARSEDTGRTFLGPIIGDYTLTAIGTRLLTGSCVGTGTMIAQSGFAPKFTGRFSFLTDDGCEPYDIERFIDMARRMTTRRGCGIKAAEEELLRAVHRGPLQPSNVVIT